MHKWNLCDEIITHEELEFSRNWHIVPDVLHTHLEVLTTESYVVITYQRQRQLTMEGLEYKQNATGAGKARNYKLSASQSRVQESRWTQINGINGSAEERPAKESNSKREWWRDERDRRRFRGFIPSASIEMMGTARYHHQTRDTNAELDIA